MEMVLNERDIWADLCDDKKHKIDKLKDSKEMKFVNLPVKVELFDVKKNISSFKIS